MEVSSTVRDNFMHLVKDFFPSLTMHDPLYNALALGTILTIAIVIYVFARLIVRPEIARWVSKTTNIWDNALQAVSYTHLTLPTILRV